MGELGEKLEANRAERAREHLQTFKTKLTEFALKYRSRIREDPVFREQFVAMCDSVGVDPIQVSKSSGSWLGGIVGISDFYTDLSVQILTQCMLHRKSEYGSLLPVDKCLKLIQAENVSLDDIRRAIKTLDCFGSGGVRIVQVANDLFISSLPDELSKDSGAVLAAYTSPEGMTCDAIAKSLSWPRERTMHAINGLLKEGALWIDSFKGVDTYWVISLWLKTHNLA